MSGDAREQVMSWRIGAFVLVVVVGTLGWLLTAQRDAIRSLRAELAETSNEIRTPAGEVFRLRSACAELGERILKTLANDPFDHKRQVSHYSPQSGRCYVDFVAQDSPLSGRLNMLRTLYDGQTWELLAYTDTTEKRRSGNVFDMPYVNSHPYITPTDEDAWSYAQEYMNAMMRDDHR
jgi:hypothetical protein